MGQAVAGGSRRLTGREGVLPDEPATCATGRGWRPSGDLRVQAGTRLACEPKRAQRLASRMRSAAAVESRSGRDTTFLLGGTRGARSSVEAGRGNDRSLGCAPGGERGSFGWCEARMAWNGEEEE